MAEYIVSVEKQEDADEIERTYACEKLIRCKDCKKKDEIECPLHRVLEDGTVYSTVKSDFYCGYGEPKGVDRNS